MKCFRKLLKGLAGWAVTIVLLLLSVIVVLGIGYVIGQSSLDLLIVTAVIYVVFVAIILLVAGIYMIVVMSVYHNAQMKLKAIPGFSEERFLRETARSPQVYRLLISSDAICYTDNSYMVKTIPLTDILWVYQKDGKSGSTCLQLYTKNRQMHTVKILAEGKSPERALRSEMSARYVLRLIARKNKNTIIGYDEELERLYKKDFEQLVKRASGREIIDSALLETEYIQNDYYHLDFQ